MLVRIRWFFLGALSMVGAGAYLATRLRRMRERLTGRNMARASVRSLADVLEAAGEAVAPTDPT